MRYSYIEKWVDWIKDSDFYSLEIKGWWPGSYIKIVNSRKNIEKARDCDEVHGKLERDSQDYVPLTKRRTRHWRFFKDNP